MSGSPEDYGLFFADNRNDDLEVDLGMQRYGNFVIADFLERTAVEMNFRPLQLEAGLHHGLADVANADGAEEFSFLADLAQDLQGHAGHPRGARLRFSERIGLGHFKLGALRLELGAVLFVGSDRLAVGNKIVARETGFHLDLFAKVSQVAHFFKLNDFHRSNLEMCV